MSRVLPYTPAEAAAASKNRIPDFVINAFNDLIAEKLYNGKAVIKQEEAIEAILKLMPSSEQSVTHEGIRGEAVRDLKKDRAKIFSRHWLDVEPLYRDQGWSVEFDKPGYNESYDGFFTFTFPH
jgi:hypothetical protein